MAFYGVNIDVAVRELNLKFKLAVQQKGGHGIRSLKRIFKQMDQNGNGKLDSSEFEQALGAFGIFLKKLEIQALMKFYDIDGDGNISYEEFTRGLRDPLTNRRMAMVDKVFQILDRDSSGKVDLRDVENIFDVSLNADFLQHRKSKDEIYREFLKNFEGTAGNKDGIITYDEFVDYYTDLSMSLASDEYFVQMMESTWQVAEKENTAETQKTIALLKKETKSRIIQLINNDKGMLRKIFNDFDLNGKQSLTIDELTNMIIKLRISVERRYIYPFFKLIDVNNSGTLEYQEFEDFIFS